MTNWGWLIIEGRGEGIRVNGSDEGDDIQNSSDAANRDRPRSGETTKASEC